MVAERCHVIIEGAAACAVAAAQSPALRAAGHRRIVAVVSGGNIDLTRFASLVGACPTDSPYAVNHVFFPRRNELTELAPPLFLPGSSRLPELARDLSWTWNPAREVFRRLDYGSGARPRTTR